MLDYPLLAALAAVIRNGSFEGAARELHVTASAISQRIKLLEERTGTVLVRRGQPCEGTPAGLTLCQHVEQVALLEGELRSRLPDLSLGGDSDGPDGGLVTLRVAVNADSLSTWFIDVMARMPDCLFDLVLDDQDHNAEWLRRGEVLAVVTSRPEPVSGCDSHPIGAMRYIATASPDFVNRHFSGGISADALARAPCLTFNRKDGLQASWLKREFPDADITPPTHWLPSSQGFVDAALAGLGWGLNPEILVADHIRCGRLLPILPDRPMDTPLYWQRNRLASNTVARLTRAVREVSERVLIQPGAPNTAG